jgi:hypothetical protein
MGRAQIYSLYVNYTAYTSIIQPLRQLYSLYGGPGRSNPGPSLLDSLADGQVQPLVLLDQLWQIESQTLNIN